jgi:hypothetical protein
MFYLKTFCHVSQQVHKGIPVNRKEFPFRLCVLVIKNWILDLNVEDVGEMFLVGKKYLKLLQVLNYSHACTLSKLAFEHHWIVLFQKWKVTLNYRFINHSYADLNTAILFHYLMNKKSNFSVINYRKPI